MIASVCSLYATRLNWTSATSPAFKQTGVQSTQFLHQPGDVHECRNVGQSLARYPAHQPGRLAHARRHLEVADRSALGGARHHVYPGLHGRPARRRFAARLSESLSVKTLTRTEG